MLRAPDAAYDALITDGDMPHLDGLCLDRAHPRVGGAPCRRPPADPGDDRQRVARRTRAMPRGGNGRVRVEAGHAPAAAGSALRDCSRPRTNVPRCHFAADVGHRPRRRATTPACIDCARTIRQPSATCCDLPFEHRQGRGRVPCRPAWTAPSEELRHLAHRMASGCLQLGEVQAQQALQSIEDAAGVAADARGLSARRRRRSRTHWRAPAASSRRNTNGDVTAGRSGTRRRMRGRWPPCHSRRAHCACPSPR